MNISSIPANKATATDIAPETLANNRNLSEHQKIAEASRQFEAMLLRQILSETQKPVIKTAYTDNSASAGIYQDFITNELSDSLSKSGTLGFAQVFERQLDRPDAKTGPVSTAMAPTHFHPTTPSSHE